MNKTLSLLFAITLMFVLVGCSEEKKEILRQEVIIEEFAAIYFDMDSYSDYACEKYINDSSNNDGITFFDCVIDMGHDVYDDYLTERPFAESFNSTFNGLIMNSFYGVDFSVSYVVIAPDSLEFPNVFQIEVTVYTDSDLDLDYIINVEVEGDKITRFSEHRSA